MPINKSKEKPRKSYSLVNRKVFEFPKEYDNQKFKEHYYNGTELLKEGNYGAAKNKFVEAFNSSYAFYHDYDWPKIYCRFALAKCALLEGDLLLKSGKNQYAEKRFFDASNLLRDLEEEVGGEKKSQVLYYHSIADFQSLSLCQGYKWRDFTTVALKINEAIRLLDPLANKSGLHYFASEARKNVFSDGEGDSFLYFYFTDKQYEKFGRDYSAMMIMLWNMETGLKNEEFISDLKNMVTSFFEKAVPESFRNAVRYELNALGFLEYIEEKAGIDLSKAKGLFSSD